MNGNVAELLTAMADRQPDVPAVIEARTGRRCSFRELDEDTNRIARGLRAVGVGPGTRTSVMVPYGIDLFAIMFGLFKAGAIPVLIDPRIGRVAVRTCLDEVRPEAFIGIPRAQIARLLFGWARGSIRTTITVGGPAMFGGMTLDRLRRSAGVALSDGSKAGDMAAILFTSGSTGLPKGAVYLHSTFTTQVGMIQKMYGIEAGEVDLATFPPFALFDPALGTTAIVPDMDASRPGSADPAKLVRAIEQYRPTTMFGSPAVIDRLGRHKVKLPSLRRVLSAGAPMQPEVLERFIPSLNPGVQVFTPYGATEALPVASIGSDEILGETRRGTDAGRGICVGRPVDGVNVSIIEISDRAIAKPGDIRVLGVDEIGEIVASSPAVTREYFNRREATALAKIPNADGSIAHRMGDLGYFDDRGRLWYVGRKSQRVVTSDGPLFTEQVEGVFNARGFRTALVGVDRGGITLPVVIVEVRRGAASPEERQLHEVAEGNPVASRVSKFLVHRGPFPVDIRHNAKIRREALASWAARELS